ncbi:excalibur calcium-binding domain-containing protein [Occultella aeris]
MDCPDFASRADAQTTFNHYVRLGLGDVHRLDGDNDGIACESHFG